MANKKVSQLTSKPSVLVTDLFPIADPTTGQLFKTTISALGTAIGSGVSSVNTLVGAVVLDTDDIQELASPTNRYFTDTRARAALSASSPLVYNSGTGAFSIPAATTSVNGYLTSTDWTTFNAKQAALSGTGFVKISGTTISYDNSTYLTTSAAASTYLALAGGTLTGALNGTSANFSGDLTLTGTNPRFYLTDSDNNPDYFISNTDGTFTIYDVTNSVSRLTINSTTATLGANLTATSLIKSGGTSSQFLKADGSVDSTAYVSGSGATGRYAIWTGTGVISDGFIQTTSNITYVEGMGLSTLNGIEINGNFGSGSGTAGLKIKSYDETTGKAFIEFINTSGVFRLGIESSTGGSILPGSTAYATVLTSGLTAKNLELGTNNTKRLTIDGTTGAVTLTSTISATGATLTGALSGTSATFSGNIISSAGNFAVFNGGSIEVYNTGTTNYFDLKSTGGNFALRTNVGSSAVNALTIASTGAATFSSSVTATQFNASISTSGAVASVPNLAYFKNQGSGYVAKIAIGEGTTSDSYISHTGGNTTATQLLGFGVNAYNQMVLTGDGSVGIGTTAPSTKLQIEDGFISTYHNINATGAGYGLQFFTNGGGSKNTIAVIDISQLGTARSGEMIFSTSNAGAPSERMRITSGGLLYVNTSSGDGQISVDFNANNTSGIAYKETATVSNAAFCVFKNSGGTEIGSIRRVTTTNAISFNSTSDYRLKEDLKPIKGLELVNKIKVYDYKWKSHDSRMDGVMAHELQEILPYAVTGVKDGEQMQQVDYSKIVPVMVQAIKELKAKIETLENK